MTYPYIGKWEYINTTVIFTDENAGIEIGGEMSFRDDWTEINYTNITTEYLANTYGEVKSKEHAEFIKLLSETNDIPCAVLSIDMNYTMFYVIDGCLFFCIKEIDAVGDYKKITIPLPPESNVNTPEEDFEMKPIAKNNGDNLIFGDADKCKEWPCVNDEVQTSDGNGLVKLLPDSKGYYVVSVNGEYYQYQIDELSKPKTPEQELEYNLTDLIMRARDADVDDVTIARYILSKYDITKKPQ